MSVNYLGRTERLVIECDFCDESDTFEDEPSWVDGMETAKRHGWRAHLNGKTWTHSCKSCSTDIGVLS
jgi:allantoicase